MRILNVAETTPFVIKGDSDQRRARTSVSNTATWISGLRYVQSVLGSRATA